MVIYKRRKTESNNYCRAENQHKSHSHAKNKL